MRAFIYQACLDAEAFIPNFGSLNDGRQAVVAEMAYQLGGHGLREFVHFQAHLTASQFALAAADMRQSRAYQQTHNRWERMARIMETGQ
jgi:hypothetical protein